ncbi:MAG TPA: hypothetical protein VN635_14910 [Conexibacter sp.]|nr:hypothetical protein [Conexibacter sp.]
MDRVRLLAAVLAAVVALAGCGAGERRDATERGAPPASVSAARGGAPAAQHGPWPVALPAGRGPAFRLPARGAAVAHARAVGRLRCLADRGARVHAHVELFAAGLVVPVPPGIGIAPPLRRRGAYVRGGRCSYAVRTSEPTGLLELRRGARLTLGDLFAVWGQPLGPRRLGAFRAPVRAYLDGRRWPGDPRTMPLTRRAVVVLEVGRFIPPHARYRFPPIR